MSKLYLFNTLSRKKEAFKPIKKSSVGMYTCGPTVYWDQHIGNMRAYIFADTLKRVLMYNKYKPKQIINVTDVGHLTSDADTGEDKMEKAAKREHKSAKDIGNHYLSEFKSDLEKLNVIKPSIWSKATEHIKEQIELIQTLEKKGYTYKTSDGIYFDSSKFKDYAKFANLNIEGLKAGKRINLGEKKNKTDFALWKFSENPGTRQQEWKSPWGIGFPGWHIECSAMSMKYLGKTFDIHTGGEDHIPIHHTNEIAQSEAATGKKVVNYWMHNAFLVFNGKKVSKSTGGLATISELEKDGFSPLAYRYFCLLTHYRKKLNFSMENLEAAKTAYERIKRRISEIRKESHKGNDKTKEYEKQFVEAINNDLNMTKAVQVFHNALDDFDFEPKKKIKLLEKFDEVLGIGVKEMQEVTVILSKKLERLLEAREKLRAEKLWAEADVLRDRIKEEGYNIVDTSQGAKLEKIE